VNISEVKFAPRVVATEHEQLDGEAMDKKVYDLGALRNLPVAGTIRTAASHPEEIMAAANSHGSLASQVVSRGPDQGLVREHSPWSNRSRRGDSNPEPSAYKTPHPC
jgi:hypothetical protein